MSAVWRNHRLVSNQVVGCAKGGAGHLLRSFAVCPCEFAYSRLREFEACYVVVGDGTLRALEEERRELAWVSWLGGPLHQRRFFG